MWVPILLLSPVKIRIFAPKRPNLAPNWHFWSSGPGFAGSFGALLVGWLVVVARWLYHLFTYLDLLGNMIPCSICHFYRP